MSATARVPRLCQPGGWCKVQTRLKQPWHTLPAKTILTSRRIDDVSRKRGRRLQHPRHGRGGRAGARSWEVSVNQISILAKDIQDEKKVHGYVTACDVSKTGAKTGAWVGGIFGLLVGSAFLWVPGVGPLIIAGSLAAALRGARKAP